MRKGSLFFKPKPRTREISRKRWNWPSIFWRAIKKTCMVIGAVVLVSALLSVMMTASLMGDRPVGIPGEMILSLTLDNGVGEQGQEPTIMDPFPFRRPTVHQIVDNLDAAAADDRVKALVVYLEAGGIDIAHIQEVRAAVKRFRASGKKAIIHSTSYGDFGEGLGSYYLASAFDEIWMQPVGMISIAGIGLEMPFARTLLEKIGARAQFFQREEYKNAMESFTSDSMSPASRESVRNLVDSMSGQMVKDITNDRKIKAPVFTALVDKGLLTGKEALDAKLIDRLDYADVMMAELQASLGGDPEKDKPESVMLEDYDASRTPARGPKVALIYASGMIAPAGSGEGVADAGRISDAIDEAADNDQYKTIVIRIDSPGGSPSASETIRHAIVNAKKDGKKVIVSMGPMAASGGYWIATDADRIFALPATLTGSIGVIMGKFELSGLWQKIGVNWEDATWGQNAGLWSTNKPFTPSQTERMNVLIDDIYDAFVDRVAQGRNLPREQVLQNAKGRAWTGEDALKLGLVDEIGGLDSALDLAATFSDAKDRHGIAIDILPQPKGALEQFIAMFGAQARMGGALQTVDGLRQQIRVMNGGALSYDPVLGSVR